MRLLIKEGRNVPSKDTVGKSDPYVSVEIYSKGSGEAFAKAQTPHVNNDANPAWNHEVEFPTEGLEGESWEVDDIEVKFSIHDADHLRNEYIGHCTVPLKDLLMEPDVRLLMCDKNGTPVVATKEPHWPCEVLVEVVERPDGWPAKVELEPPESYPRHIFMMTRGTRGDVQPFVALARGMAESRGWLVTICTEYRWKSFVQKHADVSQGRIDFIPSGGDTEMRCNSAMGKWAMNQTTEFMQMMMLSNSESEFFPSGPVIIHQIKAVDEYKPVDLLIFGLTLTGVAMMASELCGKPMAGFFLQPSCIPSQDEEWNAVQPIKSHGLGLLDSLESHLFTGHGSLDLLKTFAEENPFSMWNITKMRGWHDLPKVDTWDVMKAQNMPIIIPMRSDTFPRPGDWWDGVRLTDFIFLRSGAPGDGPASLGEPIDGFIAAAREADAKLGIMTFSSMPVSRNTVAEILVKMVEGCTSDLRMLYVGKRQPDELSGERAAKMEQLAAEGRVLELERADFGALFGQMDIFVVHGGLGTTVEALRMKRPVCVTGPLLMDQRFWGSVCHQKGVGPPPVIAADFEKTCAAFAEGALHPDDPSGWQATASEQDWGDTADDGVEANVASFEELLDSGLGPVQTRE